MTVANRSTGYRKKPSTEPAQTTPKPKAVVTIHSDGRVTATGPDAAAGKAEAEKSVARVKSSVAETNKYELEHGGGEDAGRRVKPKATSGLGINLADVGKKILNVAEAQDPSSSITRKYVGDEAKNLADVAKESVSPGRQARGIVKAPSAKETQAALTIVGGTTGGAEAGAGEKALAKAASQASNAETAAKAGAKVVAKLKGAPKQIAKDVRNYPKKKVAAVKSAPRRAKATAKRAPELKTKAGQKAAAKATGKAARKHPVRTGYLGAAALPPGVVPGEIGERARAAAVGSAEAIWNHPGETLKTTARQLPAAITGPVALGAAAVDSVVHGTPAPLVNTAKEQVKGVEQIAATTFSGDTKKAEEAARKEGSLAFLTPIPALTKLKPVRAAAGDLKDAAGAARRTVASKGDRLNRKVRHAPKGETEPLTAIGARHKQRKRVSVIKARTDNPHRVAGAEHQANVLHSLADAPKGSHITLQTLAEYGIRDKRGADFIKAKGPGDKQLLAALHYTDLHPGIWKNEGVSDALKHYAKSIEGTAATQADKGERARVLPQGDALGITRPEHMVPFHKREVFGDRSWADAAAELEDVLKAQRKAHKDASSNEGSRTLEKQAEARAQKNEEAWHSAKKEVAEEKAHLKEGQALLRKVKSQGNDASLMKFEDRVAGSSDRLKEKMAREMEARAAFEKTLSGIKGSRRRDREAAQKAAETKAAIKADVEKTQEMLKEAKKGAKTKVNNNRSKKVWITDAEGKKVKVRVPVHPYGDRELKEYVDKVEAAREPEGLEKAIYTAHRAASGDKGAGFEGGFKTPAGRKEYAREGHLAKADELDRSLEGLVRNSILRPRSNAAGKEFMRNIADEYQKPFTIDGKQVDVGHGSEDWQKITQRKSAENPDGGQFDPKHYARLPYREFNNSIDDPYLSDAHRSERLQSILKAAEDGKSPGNEPFIVVPREVVKEIRAQIDPEANIITKGMGEFSKLSSRLLLGTNPAWLIAQTVAEGVPLLISHPHLANPAYLHRLYKDSKAYGDRHPELRATAGVSPLNAAALRQPHEEVESYTPEQWSAGADAATRGRTARWALSFAKLRALGEADVRRQNAYRKAIYAAEADRKFRSWHSGLTGMFDGAAAVSKKFRGKSRAELWDWLNTTKEGKAWKGRLEDHVDAVEGNWTAFTRYERALAPFAIFYSFLRYSLRWALWAFPKEHPVRATVMNLLGQANSNQLEALLGQQAFEEGKAKTNAPITPNPLAFSLPIYENKDNEAVTLPGGSRISPGQSSITNSIASGNPAALLQSANPFLGAGLEAVTGVEPFTNEQVKQRGLAAIESLMHLGTPFRVKVPSGVPVLGGESLTDRALGAVGVDTEESVASKAFAKYNKDKEARSVVMPFIPQSGKDWAGSELLSRDFGSKYSDPIPELSDNPAINEAIYGKDGKGGWINGEKAPLLKLVKEHKISQAATERISEEEKPFYGNEPPLTKKQEDLRNEAYELAQGGILIQTESPKEKRKKEEETNPFGLPSSDPSKLREEFGLPSTSTKALKEQFGIG